MENASYFFSIDLSTFLGMLWWQDCPRLLAPPQDISPKYVRHLKAEYACYYPC